MTEKPGKTRAGKPITDELLEKLTAQAEEGFDVEEILIRRGRRPPAGAAQASSPTPSLGRPSSSRPND